MRQIIELLSYLRQAFRLWRKAQRKKLLIWLDEKKTLALFEVKRYVLLAKSKGGSNLRIAYMKMLYSIVAKLDELITRGN